MNTVQMACDLSDCPLQGYFLFSDPVKVIELLVYTCSSLAEDDPVKTLSA